MQERQQVKRRAERKALCYYLKVIDLKTGKLLGRIVDITSEGMAICSAQPLKQTKPYSVRVLLGKGLFDSKAGNLDIDVQIRWAKPDDNPSVLLTGMLFLDLDDVKRKTIKILIDKIGMNRRLDLTEEDIENGFFDDEDEL